MKNNIGKDVLVKRNRIGEEEEKKKRKTKKSYNKTFLVILLLLLFFYSCIVTIAIGLVSEEVDQDDGKEWKADDDGGRKDDKDKAGKNDILITSYHFVVCLHFFFISVYCK